MKPPPWLQELRDLLAITRDDQRRDAMKCWEARWLMDLHARQFVSPNMHETASQDHGGTDHGAESRSRLGW
jgi:hypothetical protein